MCVCVYSCACVRAWACVRSCMGVCVHAYVYVRVRPCVHACLCMSVHLCVCVSVCVCECVCVPPQAGHTVHSYALVCVFFESFSDQLQPAKNQLHWRSSTILKGEVLQGERGIDEQFLSLLCCLCHMTPSPSTELRML